jgi:CRISPR system Cascade subunit CasC
MFIELHIIQNFPPSNLNRDDLGQPKDADFGGFRRARVSSQCLKRSTRYVGKNDASGAQPVFVRHTGVPLGSRTQLIMRPLKRLLHVAHSHSEQDSERVARALTDALDLGAKEDSNLGNHLKTNVLLFLSNDELKAIAAKLHANWDKLIVALSPTTPQGEIARQLVATIAQRTQPPAKSDSIAVGKVSAEIAERLKDKLGDTKKIADAFKKAFDTVKGDIKSVSINELNWVTTEIIKQSAAIEAAMNAGSPLAPIAEEAWKSIEARTSAPDIALFGRMLAQKPTTNIDAACQVAHAISTHAIAGRTPTDYYTAMDDEKSSKEPGAGFLDTAYFNSACFYRYARLDFALLQANLRKEDLQGNALHDLPRRTVEAFLRASEAAIPTGKQNAYAQQARPSFMLAVLRDKESEGWSLVNAFQKPVGQSETLKDGVVLASVKKLEDRFEHLISFYGDETVKAVAVALPDGEVRDADLNERFRKATKNMNDWVRTICDPLP